jgi:hypothetical protein
MSGIVGSYFNTRGSGVVAKLGTDGQVFTSTGAGLSQGFEAAAAGGDINFKNFLINGDMSVGQRGLAITAPNDDTYHLDRWLILSDGNDAVDITQSSTAPTNQLYSCALDVETANKKFGIAQIIENKNCTGLIGQTATLSFKAKCSAVDKLDNVKAAIISWSSTADAVTSDLVSAWGVEGTNPTLASNLTYENTPANLSVTTSWATYSVSAAIDTASTTNVAVFIWSDVTDTTAGQFLYITDVQLEVAAAATDFERLPHDQVLLRCQRYYQKSFEYSTTPVDNSTKFEYHRISVFTGSSVSGIISYYKAEMRTTPTVTIYTSAQSANGTGKISFYTGSWTNGDIEIQSGSTSKFFHLAGSCSSILLAQFNYEATAEL